jgi:hypothetical protein
LSDYRTIARHVLWLAFAGVPGVAPIRAAEVNLWPAMVSQFDVDRRLDSWQSSGPLFFRDLTPAGTEVVGSRPFYLRKQTSGDKESAYFLYPLLTWRRQGDASQFSLFNLVNETREPDPATGRERRGFDFWPVYFSRDTGVPDTSYRALFPLGGTIRNRLGYDTLAWRAFPLYARAEQSGRTTTYAPWPFVRVIDGAGHSGFEFWPLFGERGRAGDYREQFWLWPLFYHDTHRLAAPEPDVKVGALPFYTREQGPGYRSENYLWPLFGHTDRTVPKRYRETRYLWPLFVQGRGEERTVDRWAPFYSRSNVRGVDKTWLLWPLFREARWQEGRVAQHDVQLLWRLFVSQEQRSLANPAAAPANCTHFWPLYSAWDNGAGQRQFQAFSPFEIFFPANEPVRQLYTPLFALFRYDQRAPDDIRWSLFWDGVTWRQKAAATEFHLGPLLGVATSPDEQRVALAGGLCGMWRRPGERLWRAFLFDFRPKTVTKAPAVPSP